MTLVNVLVVIFGIVISIITLVLVFFLWKFMKLRKQQKEEKKKEVSLDEFPYTTDFEKVPFIRRTMSPQVPVGNHKKGGVVGPVNNLKHDSPEESPRLSNISKQNFPTRRKTQSVTELRNAERQNSTTMSAALMRKKFGTLPGQSTFDMASSEERSIVTKERRINTRMMQDLRQQAVESRTPKAGRRCSTFASDVMINRLLTSAAHGHQDSFDDSDQDSILSAFSGNESDMNLDDSLNSRGFSSFDHSTNRRLGITRNSNVPALKSSYRKAGKILFSTEYSEDQKTLRVHIQQAMNLTPQREESSVSAFVRLSLEPGKKQRQQTKVIRGTKEPVYEEIFKFANLKKSEFSYHKLKLKVYNSAMLMTMLKNECLGEANIFLSSLDVTLKETFSLDLLLRKSEVCKSSILVSLCHQGTFSKLEVIIHEAKKLPKKHSTPNSNPYVVVALYKEDAVETKETVYQMNNRNPIFNESFDFTVQTDHATPLSAYSLVVTVIHKSLVRKDWTIGHVIYSLSSPQESAKHQWKIVQAEPHRRHSEWHYLLDPKDL